MNQIVLTLATTTAAATINNVYNGQRIADLPATFGQRFRCSFISCASVTGMTEQLFVGSRLEVIQLSHVSVVGAAARIVTRDDIVATFLAEAGEKIVLTVNGVVGTHFSRLIVTPIAA